VRQGKFVGQSRRSCHQLSTYIYSLNICFSPVLFSLSCFTNFDIFIVIVTIMQVRVICEMRNLWNVSHRFLANYSLSASSLTSRILQLSYHRPYHATFHEFQRVQVTRRMAVDGYQNTSPNLHIIEESHYVPMTGNHRLKNKGKRTTHCNFII